LELHVHVTAKISIALILLLLYRRVLAVASMVRQAQVSVVIDHGKSVKNCKNEEFELPCSFIIKLVVFFLSAFSFGNFVFIHLSTILFYSSLSCYSYPTLLLHLIVQNTNGLEKLLTKNEDHYDLHYGSKKSAPARAPRYREPKPLISLER